MTALRQFSRYVIVGVSSNGVLYGCYLELTVGLLVDPKLAMSITYIAGIILSFVLNRSWTFDSKTGINRSLPRYVVLYLSGYVINYACLSLFHYRFGVPHQLVQIAVMTFLVFYLFAMSRLWVFKKDRVVHS